MRKITKQHVFYCDACHKECSERIWTPVDSDSPNGPHYVFHTVRFGKKYRHYCNSCWDWRHLLNSFMSESYLEAVRRNIPLPQEVMNWFYDQAEYYPTNGIGNVMKKYGIKLSPWYYHRYGGKDGKGWRKESSRSSTTHTPGELVEDIKPETTNGRVNTVELASEERVFRLRVAGPITHVRAYWEDR